jgi:hypothetical protein
MKRVFSGRVSASIAWEPFRQADELVCAFGFARIQQARIGSGRIDDYMM